MVLGELSQQLLLPRLGVLTWRAGQPPRTPAKGRRANTSKVFSVGLELAKHRINISDGLAGPGEHCPPTSSPRLDSRERLYVYPHRFLSPQTPATCFSVYSSVLDLGNGTRSRILLVYFELKLLWELCDCS